MSYPAAVEICGFGGALLLSTTFPLGSVQWTAGDRSAAIGVLGSLIALALVNKVFLLCRRYALHTCTWGFSSALCPPTNNRPETWENENSPSLFIVSIHSSIFDQHRSQCNTRLEKSFVSGQ